MKKLGFILATMPLFASAGLFRFSNFTVGGVANPEIQAAIEAEINKQLPSADTQEEYFNGMSEANAMSAAGVTTSYGTVFDKFLIGVTASGGAHLGEKNFSDFGDLSDNLEQFRGFGAQAAIIAGVNVGNLFGWEPSFFDPRDLKLYLSGFALNRKFGDVNAKYFGAGVGLQYRIIHERDLGARLVKWTGVDIGTGLLYSKLDFDASVDLDRTYETTSNGTDITATLSNSTADITANVSTFSIPIEVSTGLRLFYFFKLIGGVGLDLNFGSTKGSGELSSGSAVTGDAGGAAIAGDPEFDIDGSDGPDFANARVFAGPHIEFGVGSIFANVHRSLFKNAMAVNAGVNFFW